MMVILDRRSFGLSQLHQLRGPRGPGRPVLGVRGDHRRRGRVHRLPRLKAFAETADGFALAEADLELRSEGNVLGAAQSGDAPISTWCGSLGTAT